MGKSGVTLAACVATATIVLIVVLEFRKRRKQNNNSNSCYLKTETEKPQNCFKRVLSDNSYSPFKHLTSQTHGSKENSSCEHPYKAEIEALLKSVQVEFSFLVDENVDLKPCGSYVWIETELQLKELSDVLSKEKVFGVDTEQHSLRSFLGFTSLIQISTVKNDYLVDSIALHDVMGILRPVFSNPAICKVFHGADNDVLWLQRDFHIYVVNLFDTAKACENLSKPQKSLAYLLESYCDVATNKLLQREDWRQRPLPIEMLQYAQMDAHYLLHIARSLASELILLGACPDDKFRFVLEASRRSNAICLQLFTKENEANPGESAASSILSRYFHDQRRHVPQSSDTQDLVRRLCTWRDLMARVHDESLRYVLSDHAIAALVQNLPILETDIYNTICEAELNADSPNLVSTLQYPSPVICSHLEDLEYILSDEITSLDDIVKLILQEHMGRNGSCPLSLYNYNILAKVNYKAANGLVVKQNGVKKARRIGKKASRQLFVQKFSCKAPVYHNCRIYANDGRLLCYCDRRKLEWYLSRDLAKLVEDNPPAIMLLFEPKGRPEDEGNDFYIQSKKNICVGCGEANHYLRYRIIPSCYRIHFPEHLKSHRSHDIVLVCVDCHEIAHAAAEKHKRQIAAEYGIPLFVRRVVDSKQIQGELDYTESLKEDGVSPLELRSAAMALLRHGPRMPPKRRNELTQEDGVSPLELRSAVMALLRHGPRMPPKRLNELTQFKTVVMKYYGGREISEEDLENALLVGMSPHERRRFQKKKGSVFKKLFGKTIQNKHESSHVEVIPTSFSSSNPDNVGDLYASLRDKCSEEEITDMADDVDTNTEVFDGDDKQIICDENGFSDTVLISNPEGTISAKHSSKLSLLGHGPHGNQVVEHIMREYGEEGIRQFCQKWRQVFVEAIHPRFLPGGWDVMHSGRREFGEFSVYNPDKRTSIEHSPTKQGAAAASGCSHYISDMG